MSNEQAQNRIIEKIRKLFALANGKGTSGNEAENALRMANKLLAKHSLEMTQLTGNDEVFCSFMDYNLKAPGFKSIIGSICRLYNCRVIFDYNWPKPKTLIIGSGANRVTTVIVIEQLLDQVKKECKGKNASFKHGAAIGLNDVCQRIIDERKADKTEILPGTGLVPLDQMEQQKVAVDGFIDDNFKNLKPSRATRGSMEGRQYGNGLNPGARVTGEGQRRLN